MSESTISTIEVPCETCICKPQCRTIISKKAMNGPSCIWDLMKNCSILDKYFRYYNVKMIYETFDCIHIYNKEWKG